MSSEKWKVGQRVLYLYVPRRKDGEPKEFNGKIVKISDRCIYVKWDNVEDFQTYTYDSYIERHLEEGHSFLDEGNPNTVFKVMKRRGENR